MRVAPASAIASAITQRDFDAALDALGPFEAAPALAVAVSGGADSLAAALLCHAWARARGGAATALIVDHGLRPESADEAARARALLAGHGMAATILALGDTGGDRNLQAAARAGRYDALARWCRDTGVLHLVTGHHRGDQAETFFLRLMRGSGVDGLSAMAAVQPAPGCRILRPLLDTDPDRLRAYLRDQGVDWIEDPSNRDTRFRRVQVRGVLARMADGARLADGTRVADGDDVAARAAAAAAEFRPGPAHARSRRRRARGRDGAARARGLRPPRRRRAGRRPRGRRPARAGADDPLHRRPRPGPPLRPAAGRLRGVTN